jgi:hypothetical protein
VLLVRYELVPNVTLHLWEQLSNQSRGATFFHTPAWANLLIETFPRWQVATWGIQFEDGNVAVVPMTKYPIFGRGTAYWYESTAPGVYGGPLFRKEPGHDHYLTIWTELAKRGNFSLSGNPFASWELSDPKSRVLFTQILDLENDFAKIYRGFSMGRRHTIKFAKKSGVTTEYTTQRKDFLEYYDVYLDQLKRWGKNATDFYPRRLFENLAVLAAQDSRVKLWVARFEGKVISGLVVLYQNQHLVTWHGATLESHFKYRPVDLLYSAVIKEACESGYKYFDFNYSGGHENVVYFKERYGARKVPYSICKQVTPIGYWYRLQRQLRLKRGLCPLE